jgi:hypothetical protein
MRRVRTLCDEPLRLLVDASFVEQDSEWDLLAPGLT